MDEACELAMVAWLKCVRQRGPCSPMRTQPGNVALDGDDGHSPYTKALVETMRKSGLDVLQAFNQVGLIVKRATGSAQQPWVSTSPIDGSFYFAGVSPAQQVTVATPVAPTPTPKTFSAARSLEQRASEFATEHIESIE